MPVPNDPLAILDRLSVGNISEADLDLLRQHLSTSGNQNTVQVGKYNVNIGQGQDIQIGDRIYQGIDADALKETLRAILHESQLYLGKSGQILWQYRHTFRGHLDSVNAVIITSDSNTLISASDDKTIKVWSLNPPKPHLTFPQQNDDVICVAIAPDNQTLISGDKEGTVQIWNLHTGKIVQTLSKVHKKCIHTLAISPDGKTFTTGSADKTLQIWNLNSLHRLYTSPKQNAEVMAVAIAPDNQTLISGDEEGTVQIWSLPTGELLKTLPNVHEKSINSLALSPNGEMFATGSSDKTIKFWNLKTGNWLQTLNQEGGSEEEGNTSINAIAFCPDNETLISGSEGGKIGLGPTRVYRGGTIRIWNFRTRKSVETKSHAHTSPINSLAISPDGQTLATASKGGTILLWQKVQS